jgi:MoaA/NifB/PqqE/SkfB family radical SAM enzyme
MTLRKPAAWYFAKALNWHPLVRDTARNEVFFAALYGTPRKYKNYLKVKREYRQFREVVTSYPYILRIEPVSACNLSCPLCPTGAGQFDRPATMMSENAYESLLEELRDFIFFVRMYIWGDPLLNKNLSRLVAMTEQRGIGSEISTNLSLPLTDAAIDRLIEAGLGWLIVSIDGATRDTYQKYRRNGDFNLVVANSERIAARKRLLRSKTPYLEWQFIPLRHNEHEMADIVDLSKVSGADGVRFKPARFDKLSESASPAAYETITAQWSPKFTKSHRTSAAYLGSHCSFLWGHATVHSDGGIASCCENHEQKYDVGHLRQGSFLEQWNGPAIRRLRRAALGADLEPDEEITPCHSCKVFEKPLAADPEVRRVHSGMRAGPVPLKLDHVVSSDSGKGR